jgi:hypothetical protein
MPYYNWRSHNSPAFHKLHVKPLSFLIPTLILFNKLHVKPLSLPSKRGILEKRGGKDWWEKKEWNLSAKAPCFEKRKEREDEIYKSLGENPLKERKKGDHNFL